MNKIKPFENYSNTIFDRLPEQRNKKSIFVSIVSYRDSNVIDTVRSLFENAKRPENIYVSVAIASIFNHEYTWSGEDQFKEMVGGKDHVTVKRVEVEEGFSIGELRSIADSAYNKEMFYMSVSSSSEFDPYWDDILIKSYDSVFELSKDTNFIFTCIPRYFVRHDDVLDGYVFYTNHKTRVSMQREERDSSKIPTVGYSEFINFDDLYNPFMKRADRETASHIDQLISQQNAGRDFLKEQGYPVMGYRHFFDNEVISLSHGFSSKFVFGGAKTILKCNPAKKELITEEQNDFMSMINFIDSGIMLFSLRWTPVYYMPDHSVALSEKRKTPMEMVKDKEQLIPGKELIDKKVDSIIESDDLDKREVFSSLCGIDWENKDFKLSRNAMNSTICNGINTFVSLYNFSINENSLHWNRRG